jgi:hypothetical protein
MPTFTHAVLNQEARTANNMKARASTGNACVDLFSRIGAMRGQDIVPLFLAAYAENKEYALRIALWARDVRGGAGERELFRQILRCLEVHGPEDISRLIPRIPDVGRWDDLLVFSSAVNKQQAYRLIAASLFAGNGLASKWMPRKGPIATELSKFLGFGTQMVAKRLPKDQGGLVVGRVEAQSSAYRKFLFEHTNVVETKMCNRDWDNINFSHVPSLAAARYRKAFYKRTPKFAEYVETLKKNPSAAKVNAAAVYPYDVIRGVKSATNNTEKEFIVAQWDALPNYIGDAPILPLVDVSGSMYTPAGGPKSKVSCIDIALSLGLYCAEKNLGPFKDTFLTFTSQSKLLHLKGDIVTKMAQMARAEWGGSTNLHSAVELILDTAIKGNVEPENMPKMLLIMSDMQFDMCIRHDDSAIQMLARKYSAAGYEMPKIVFWNLNASFDNSPVEYTKNDVALVSGFSPAILKSILSNNLEKFTPENLMLDAIMNPRYDLAA